MIEYFLTVEVKLVGFTQNAIAKKNIYIYIIFKMGTKMLKAVNKKNQNLIFCKCQKKKKIIKILKTKSMRIWHNIDISFF